MKNATLQKFAEWGEEAGLPVNRAPVANTDGGQTSEIQSLPCATCPEPGEFPLDALNGIQRAMAESAAEVYQIAPQLPAMASLATHAAAIGKGATIQGAVNGRHSHCNLFVLAGAPKSYGKGATGCIVHPLIAASSELAENFRLHERPGLVRDQKILEKRTQNIVLTLAKNGLSGDGKPLSDADVARLKAELDAAERQLAEIEPLVKLLPSYWIGSATTAAFVDFLSRNGDAMFSYSPEAGELIRIALGKFTKDSAADFELFLSGFSVEPYRETRITRGDSNLVPCISVLWMAQPFLFRELYGSEEALERGLTARVLPFIVEHDIIPEDDGVVRAVSERTNQDWADLVRRTLAARNEPRVIRCTGEAREVFRAFHNEAVALRNGRFRDIEGELGRWRENAIRIAGGQCVADAAEAGDDDSQTLTLTPEQATRGVRLARWAHLSGLSLMQAGLSERKQARVSALRVVLTEQYGGTATLRDLERRNGFAPADVRALGVDFPHLLTVAKIETGGRPSETACIPKG